jgi:DNA-binding MarR family transcriptional regulator
MAGILQAAQRLRAVLAANYNRCGLSEVRYAVLERLERASPNGCSQTELAEMLGQSESSVSTLVERMRASGLIYRLRSKSDRRMRVLLLTDHGRQLLATARRGHDERIASLLSQFQDRDKQLFADMLRNLLVELTEIAAAATAIPMDAASDDRLSTDDNRHSAA